MTKERLDKIKTDTKIVICIVTLIGLTAFVYYYDFHPLFRAYAVSLAFITGQFYAASIIRIIEKLKR
jgi:hypothetical protein